MVDCPQSTIVSGTTPSGCTLRAPTGSDPTRSARRSRVQGVKKEEERKNSDHGRLPAVDRGLGDYTQWVHLACPHSAGPPGSSKKKKNYSDPGRLPAVDRGLGDYTHWVHLACPHRFRSHSPRTSGRAQIPKTTKHRVGVQIRRKTIRDCMKENISGRIS